MNKDVDYMEKINTVKDIKKLIDKVILPNYKYKTNFSCAEFLIDINFKLIIQAKPICTEEEFHYEFVLDTQFLSEKEITYNELIMVKNVIDILEKNKKFVLSRLKKYTVEEYKAELKIREERSKMMFASLKRILEDKMISRGE